MMKIIGTLSTLLPLIAVAQNEVPDSIVTQELNEVIIQAPKVSTTVRDSRYTLKKIAVQILGGYFCDSFQRSGSRSRYFSIGVFGGHAAHRSMMSQK